MDLSHAEPVGNKAELEKLANARFAIGGRT